jgi:penicillin-binding protein 1A
MWGGGGAIVVGASAAIGMLVVLYFQVFFGDDSHLKKSAIVARINEETALYYLDETTQIGSFFADSHRRYVPIEEMPAHLINAVVASEDKYFYDHSGINPMAIFKAAGEGISNFVKTGHPRFRGGSTITQQTVKNLLDKKEYSLSRKFREAIAALQLERMYSKRQILEFYLNQFHVAANGNGIGIAAKYYFNKDVRDLDLVEAGFIAGSVKGPSKYNPFIKYTPEERAKAWRFANYRKNYVLRRMYEQNWITEEELRTAWDKPVPFNKGKFTTKEVALTTLIRSQLKRKEILEALGVENIDELNHAGLKVFTTLDAELQEEAQLMMRRNLSKLETILQGFKAEDPKNYRALRELDVGEFYYGKVEKVNRTGPNKSIELDFGLPKGTISNDSIVRYAKLMDIAVQQGYETKVTELMKVINPGDILYVEIKSYDKETHHADVEFYRRPIVSGGLIAIDKGEMRAVVSGFDPEGYNRAIYATRQPGSVFKAVSYYAAMQLGWTMLDRLDNERRLFPYQGQFYYPRPDHDTPFRDVSMIWAGAKSENLASIYVTYKLIEKLNLEQFKGLLGMMDLLPKEGEAKRDYHYRVARKVGVQLDNDGIREFQLQNAITDVAPDLVFAGDNDLLRQMGKMWWGRGYASELQRLYITEDEDAGAEEIRLRINLVKNNYQRHAILATNLESDWNAVAQKVESAGAEGVLSDAELTKVLSRFRVMQGSGNRPQLGYFRTLPEEEPANQAKVTISLESTPGRALNSLDINAIWGKTGIFTTSANITLRDVRLEGYLPLAKFRQVQDRLEERFRAVIAIQEPYDLPYYYHHHDFRVGIGLKYLELLCESMGVFSKIEPVLSFPLGTNVVSLGEVAKIYQTFIEGKIYRFYEDGPANQLNFIRRIEDRFGNVLFEPKKQEYQLVPPEYSVQIKQILRKVVTHGTGRRARGELFINIAESETGTKSKVLPVRIPAFGKTGTTNDYTTASFAGFIPYPVAVKAPLDPANSYVLASYVGYDFNREMRRGAYKVGGAYGALPVWTDLAKAIIEKKKYIDFVDRLDLKIISNQEWPLTNEKDAANVKVDLARGVILREADNKEAELFATTNIDVTGEEFVNEFALDSSVRSTVRIPVTNSGGDIMSPLRMVSPFVPWKEEDKGKKGKEESQGPVLNIPSQVDLNAMSRFPGDAQSSSDDVSFKSGPTEPRGSSNTTLPDRAPIPTLKPEPPEAVAPLSKPSVDDVVNDIKNEDRNLKSEPAGPKDGGNDDPGFIEEELW